LVYSSAAVILIVLALIAQSTAPAGTPALLDYPLVAYALLFGLAIGPQLLGHSAFNWALRYLSATFVAVAILGEPIGAALLAVVLFGEGFAPLQIGGFVLLLAGIVLAAWAEAASVAASGLAASGSAKLREA
jgi:drug/metabolite transporter (DMT)-like permease